MSDVNGFTIECDGNPVYVERLLTAFYRELEQIRSELEREERQQMLFPLRDWWFRVPVLMPVQGTISLRSPIA